LSLAPAGRGPTPGRRLGALAEGGALAVVGALHSVPFVHTSAWWLQIACVAALAWRLNSAGPARAAWLGWAFGTAWLVAGVWWLYISMHRYGGLAAPLAALAVLLLCAALATYLGVAMALYARWRSGRPGGDALLFAALWLAAELARGVLFTGFPWVAAGYAHADGPLAVLAPWVGVYGIGFAAALLASLLAAVPHGGRAAGLAVVAATAALGVGATAGPREFSRPAGTIEVTLLQTNVPQNVKFDPEHLPQTLARLARELADARGTLVVAPETAVPLLPWQLAQLDPAYWSALVERFAAGDRALLVGVPLGDFSRGYTNSVVGLSAGPPYRYDKHHLVPFGEFIPRGFRWFTDLMNIPLGDFDRGRPDPPSFGVAGQRVAPNICYEDLFGEELARRFADPATAPTVFANVSNIGWFGDTIADDQHLNISRLRALEFQRPMLRATNTGVTAVIDHRGRVTHRLEPFTRGVLDASVEGRDGLTPYARWAARTGLWPLAALSAVVVAGAALASRRRPARRRPMFRG
jgi:apolipoprotein N-acyltransferase